MEIKIKQQRRRDRDRETGSGSEHKNRKNPGLNSMVKMIPINDNNDGKVYVRAHESRREVGNRTRQDSCVMEDSVESDRIAHPGQDKTGQDKRERGACWPCEVFFRWRMVGRFGLSGMWMDVFMVAYVWSRDKTGQEQI